MINFSSGYVTVVPQAGSADITPIRAGKLQEVSLDFDFSTKELRSNKVFADDVARAGGKLTGKIKLASLRAGAFGSILSGSTTTTGQLLPMMDQPTGVISGAQFDTTVTLANFDTDLGVDDENGNPLTKIASAPAAGQYSVDLTTGPDAIYKFNAGANGKNYKVNYVKKDTTSGKLISYKNQLMGLATKYQLILQNTYNGLTISVRLYAVIIPKLSLAFKAEDYTIQDVDFTAQDDGSGNVIDMSLAN